MNWNNAVLTVAKFSEGKAKVTIPFNGTVPEGKVVKVYFINGGQRVDMNASFVDGYVVFETDHFSTYAIVLEDAPSAPGSEFPVVYAAIGAISVLALAGGAIAVKKRHS